MSNVGGSITETTMAGRPFSVTAESDVGKKLQATENEGKPNGDGTVRTIKNHVTQMIEGLVVAIDNSRGDLQFLRDLNDSPDLFDFTMAEADGSFWVGKAQISGEFKYQTQDASVELNLYLQNMEQI